MKTIAARLRLVVGVVIPLMMIACKGPAGPEGPAGPQGAAGAQGATGAQGPAGTANVISGRITATDADWSTNTIQFALGTGPGATTYGKPGRYLDIAVSEITSDVFNSGVVLVWMQMRPSSNANDYAQLPVRFLTPQGIIARHYDVRVTTGQIRILYYLENLTDPTNYGDPLSETQPTRDFRWVIIPPAAVAAAPTLPVDFGPDAVLRELETRGYEVTALR